MNNLRQAAQQALEALEGFDQFRRIMTDGPDVSDKLFAEDHAEMAFVVAARVIPALRAALAEPEQEPVAYWHSEFLKYNTTPEQPAQPEQEPQTTHWEGCEAVHPECRKPDTDCHAQGICQRSGYSIAPTPRKESTDES